MNHPNLLATVVTAAVVTAAGALAVSRVRYWRKWALDTFDHYAGTLADRINIDPALDGIAP